MSDPLTLGTICRDWFGLRRLALRRRLGPEFDRLIALARDGEEVADSLAALLELPAATAPDPTRETYAALPGAFGHVANGAYVCPGGTCPREVVRGPAQGLPYCGVHGRDMQFSPAFGSGA
ncbi:hypothetical protein ACIBEJ_50730 [Nonomuraea sp. NPDC050790]|uniref:hypothetical protein n=1 Tax=Nonomuraea sp. NPDC050790 TaxID=3364371 RepID=UPI003788DA6A